MPHAKHRAERHTAARGRLLRGASATALLTLASAATLGVGIVTPVQAGTVAPVQTTTYTLTAGGNPTTFGSATNVNVASGAAVYGAASTPWTVTNQGSLAGAADGVLLLSQSTVNNAGNIAGASAAGIYLKAGGSVTNQAGGRIASSGGRGVLIAGGAGTVVNAGTVSAASTSTAIRLGGTGSVTNQAGGLLTGGYGVAILGSGGTVTNNGTINAGTGVFLQGPGSATNAGVITGSKFGGVALTAGGTITNQLGGTISGVTYGAFTKSASSTVTNAGLISASGAANNGVDMFAGGQVINQASGTITGYIAAAVFSGSVTNAGVINGTHFGVAFTTHGGSATNQAGATIAGGDYGVGIIGGGTVTNAGTITARDAVSSGPFHLGAAGVGITGGGAVINQAGGTISGVLRGVELFNGSGTVTNAGTISGAASVEFDGTGADALILQSGSVLIGNALGSTKSGATAAVILQGAGTAQNSFLNFTSLDVTPGAAWVLDGVNTIGATTLESGAVLQVGDAAHPAASITGASLTLSSSSTLAVAISPTPGVSGTLSLTGSANLAGSLELIASPGLYRKGATYTVLTAGAISGSFATISANDGLTFSVNDPPASLVATLTKGAFTATGATANQSAVGNGLVSAPVGATDFDTVANAAAGLSGSPQLNGALDQLGGEIDADFLTIGRDSVRSVLGGVGDQLSATRDAPGDGDHAPWVRAYGGFGNLDGNGNSHGLLDSSGGAIAGLSRGWNGATVGAAFSYGHTDLRLRGLNQQGQFDTGAVALYGEERSGVFFLDEAGALSYDHGHSTRTILFAGLGRKAVGSFDGYTGAAQLAAGARMDGPAGLTFEPSVNLTYSHVEQQGFGEGDGGGADLNVAGKSQDALASTVQARLSKPFTLSSGVLRADIQAGWMHEWTPTGATITEAFAAPGAAPFTVAGATPDRDLAIVGAGVAYEASKRLTWYARYQGAVGRSQDDNALSAGFRFQW